MNLQKDFFVKYKCLMNFRRYGLICSITSSGQEFYVVHVKNKRGGLKTIFCMISNLPMFSKQNFLL